MEACQLSAIQNSSKAAAQKAGGKKDIPVISAYTNGMLQPKLAINQPGDAFEQEADHMADHIMRMPSGDIQPIPSIGGANSVQRELLQRAIDPVYPVPDQGEFQVNATPGGSNLPIDIKFHPSTTANYSNQIGLIQVVRVTNAAGGNVEPQSLPAARAGSLRTTADATTGVEGGFFTDVLHNDAPAH